MNVTLTKINHLEWTSVKNRLGLKKDTDAMNQLLALLKDGGLDKLIS